MRYYGQTLGFTGFHSSDQYDDKLRTNAALANSEGTGIMSGLQSANSSSRLGVDFTLSLSPFKIPVWMENQYMVNKESNPTGFGKEFKWKGGFHQLNWQPAKTDIAYARYDWIKGDNINDTGVTLNSVTGVTNSTPSEHDFILGWQHLVEQNVKFIGEYRRHTFEDKATSLAQPSIAKLTDDGFTVRVMFGF